MMVAIAAYMVTIIYSPHCPRNTNPTTLQIMYRCARLITHKLTNGPPTWNCKEFHLDIMQLRDACDTPRNDTEPPAQKPLTKPCVIHTRINWQRPTNGTTVGVIQAQKLFTKIAHNE